MRHHVVAIGQKLMVFLLILLVAPFIVGTTYVIREGGKIIGRYEIHDGKD